MTIQELLKAKIKESGQKQEEVAERIGMSKANISHKLSHQGAWFGSILLIAEGIGLTCRIRPIDEKTKKISREREKQLIQSACSTDPKMKKFSTEMFQELLAGMGQELAFEWRKDVDPCYMLNTHNVERNPEEE